jgi:hypothetical protein
MAVTQTRVINSEWIKFRSLRSTWWSIAGALLASVGLGILISALRGNDLANNGVHFQVGSPDGTTVAPGPGGAPGAIFMHGFPEAAGLSLRGFMLAQLAVGILGVLFVTGEYSTGMIRATLGAVPKRVPVWLAKAVVFAVSMFVISLIAAFTAFFIGQAALSAHPIHYGVSLGDPSSLRAVFGAAFYMLCVGLMGVGFGFAIRNAGGAIAGLFGLILVLPLLTNALPSSWQPDTQKALPLFAGQSLMETGVTDYGSSLTPGPAALLLAGWAVLLLVVGLATLLRRDA